jgi:prolyl 4-hydroxylase
MRLTFFALSFLLLPLVVTYAGVVEDCVVGNDGQVVCQNADEDGYDGMDDEIDLEYDSDNEMDCYVDENGDTICEYLEDDDEEEDDDFEFDEFDGEYEDDDFFGDDEEDNDFDSDEEEEEDVVSVEECVDEHKSCEFWSNHGECEANPNYMLVNCRKSCNTCRQFPVSPQRSKHVVDEKEKVLTLSAKFGVEQKAEGTEEQQTFLRIKQMIDYMKNHVHAKNPTHKMSKQVIRDCSNEHELCALWASQGECEANPSYMLVNCSPSCFSCHKISFEERCPPRDENLPPALLPNELNTMFERIVTTAPGNSTDAMQLASQRRELGADGSPIYTVTVHSRPSEIKEENGPWIITFDNFLTDQECDTLIELGYKAGYERSRDVGARKKDGTFDSYESTSRTSTNAWCSEKNGCKNDATVQKILQRLSLVTGIDSDNYEDFQLLKYEEGQFYRAHHDYIPHQRKRQPGPRILTFFLYLSDVEEEGGTGFPDLHIEVQPKKGRALLWPSVSNEDPSRIDASTRHEAITVKKGTKFAANAWIHLYDNATPTRMGCN